MSIPTYLADAARRDTDERRRNWIAALPQIVADLAERWSLVLGEPFQPGGQCSWVAPARTAAGEDLVLKVGWRHDESEHEADALRVWNGHGAVRLYAAHVSGHTSALFRALPATADRRVLLCTDLHGQNILAARRERWLVIDPKPYLGDPAYDPLQHMLNCSDRLAADPAGLAKRMADMAGLDSRRLTLWLFARCVQESVGNPLLAEVAARIAPA